MRHPALTTISFNFTSNTASFNAFWADFSRKDSFITICRVPASPRPTMRYPG